VDLKSVLILPDSDSSTLELVIPHPMLTSDWFEMKLLATFERDAKRPWMT
jgi:hypothetical protein